MAQDTVQVAPFQVTADLASEKLSPYLEIWEDPSREVQFDTILNADIQDKFQGIGPHSPNFGFSESAYWVKFRLRNDLDTPQKVVLRQDYPLIDYVDFWEPNADGHWTRHATGDRRPFASRDIDHRDFLFPIKLPAHSTQTFYLRFQSEGPVNISLALYAYDHLLTRIGVEQLALGVYYGGFLVLAVYNLFMFLVVRDRPFIHYILYVSSYGIYMAVHNGLTYQFLWPNNPWLANQCLVVLLALSLLGAMQFARSILTTAQVAQKTDFAARICEAVLLLCVVLSPFLSYRTMILPLSVLTFVVAAQLLQMGIVALLCGVRPARYYLIAWTALLIGVMVYMLKTFGVLPHNVLTQNGFQIGSLVEMVLLSLALSSRINDFKRKTYTDALTALGNRRLFDARFAQEFERARQLKRPLSLLVIDIDYFKQFNDEYGHTEGDRVLRRVARLLGENLRKRHLLCRYGGEEFVLILPGVNQQSAVVLAERLRQSMADIAEFQRDISVSIGVATLENDTFTHPEQLFDAADFALYNAKQQGRNCVVCETPESNARRATDHEKRVQSGTQANV